MKGVVRNTEEKLSRRTEENIIVLIALKHAWIAERNFPCLIGLDNLEVLQEHFSVLLQVHSEILENQRLVQESVMSAFGKIKKPSEKLT